MCQDLGKSLVSNMSSKVRENISCAIYSNYTSKSGFMVMSLPQARLIPAAKWFLQFEHGGVATKQ